MINLIVAYSNNRVIGINNQMPWHLPDDLEHFKQITLNSTIIMGRRTFESIGRILPNRTNIVVSSTLVSNKKELIIASSLEDALNKANTENIFIIGGTRLFEEAIPLVDNMYITKIHQDFEGDTFFPFFDETGFKQEIIKEVTEPIPHTFIKYSKKYD